ncbi:hypothetical protein [Solimicrobium silvestre]|nr:hypothetical protein [Solimicrobium silvestre]
MLPYLMDAEVGLTQNRSSGVTLSLLYIRTVCVGVPYWNNFA